MRKSDLVMQRRALRTSKEYRIKQKAGKKATRLFIRSLHGANKPAYLRMTVMRDEFEASMLAEGVQVKKLPRALRLTLAQCWFTKAWDSVQADKKKKGGLGKAQYQALVSAEDE